MNFKLTIDKEIDEERMRFGEFKNKSKRFLKPTEVVF